MSRKYCPDCGSLLPDEPHESWCFVRPVEQRAESAEARAAESESLASGLRVVVEQMKNTDNDWQTAFWRESERCDAKSELIDTILSTWEAMTERLIEAEENAAELIEINDILRADRDQFSNMFNAECLKVTELEKHLAGAASVVTQLTRERDEARQERDSLRMSIVNNVSA